MRLVRVLGTFVLVAVVALAVAWRVAASERGARSTRTAPTSRAAARVPRFRLPAPRTFAPGGACSIAGYCRGSGCVVFVASGSGVITPVSDLRIQPVPVRPVTGSCPLGDQGLPGTRVGPPLESASAGLRVVSRWP